MTDRTDRTPTPDPAPTPTPAPLRLTLEGGPANGGTHLVAAKNTRSWLGSSHHNPESFARWARHPVVAIPGTGDAHSCSSTRKATDAEVAALAVLCGATLSAT